MARFHFGPPKILKIIAGIAIAAGSWILSSPQRAANFNSSSSTMQIPGKELNLRDIQKYIKHGSRDFWRKLESYAKTTDRF
jgi:hypothetical protein